MNADPTPIAADRASMFAIASIDSNRRVLIGGHRRWIGGHRRFQRLSFASLDTIQ
jgi:hypothetical protein